MAYRLATYFAVEGDSSEALHWLRRAIYLGNENYPWFQKNPGVEQPAHQRRLRAHSRGFEEGLPQKPEDLEAAAGAGAAGRGVRAAQGSPYRHSRAARSQSAQFAAAS